MKKSANTLSVVLSVILSLVLPGLCAAGDAGIITTYIYDATNNKPIDGAQCSSNLGSSARSADGVCLLLVPVGRQTFTIKAWGYVKRQFDVMVNKGDAILIIPDSSTKNIMETIGNGFRHTIDEKKIVPKGSTSQAAQGADFEATMDINMLRISSTIAGTGVVTCELLDPETRQGLSGAMVHINGIGTLISNNQGFLFVLCQSGRYSGIATYGNYLPYAFSFSVEAGAYTDVVLSMTNLAGGDTTTSTTTAPPDNNCPIAKMMGDNEKTLDQLQLFRDNTLAKNAIGRKIIQIYYNNTDSINAALDRNPALQAAVRKVLEVIAPMVGKN